ncbi:MAG: hypothetical protein A2622_04075 [Bdellovibrionales bacterium RIFCSPHIGHO2_01_FULL_40_29]|nr:MAG: hypothetical protein A2622_04075 [Bdellovibrionales bacterium RIFCSPHIGHO2_01_FULL_40_29]OFZ34884.1 MAG: hypothetical protein A3D17_11300 [Bdellovibrionales bacterium RIFCSPHIGHO2_02_FULL_40_15]
MGKYLDICIQPVPKKNVADYRKTTKIVGQLLIKHGALSSSDYVADDKNATSLSFPKKIKTKSNEVLIVAMAEFKSATHRQQVFNKMLKDPRMVKLDMEPAWMDTDRALFGGFKLLVKVK